MRKLVTMSRQEDREKRQLKKKNRMKQHGKSLAKVYKNVLVKRKEE